MDDNDDDDAAGDYDDDDSCNEMLVSFLYIKYVAMWSSITPQDLS